LTSVDWARRAACRSAEPELFFPISSKGRSEADAARARRVCQSCPVRAACLEYALETRQRHGIWGGLTEDERHQLSRPGAPNDCAAGVRAPAAHP
jgi:WhiB family transcriptional regulator, redox-sensing transcriptional regulator